MIKRSDIIVIMNYVGGRNKKKFSGRFMVYGWFYMWGKKDI